MGTGENAVQGRIASWTADGPVVILAVGELRCPDSPRRGGVNSMHVRALAESATAFPPIVVHRETMCVVDGVHRLHAARSRGDEQIEARFFDGAAADVFVLAVRLNAEHGLPLSRADRVAAVVRIARTHPQLSDRAVAATTGLSDKTVASIRQSSAEVPPSNTRIGRDGRTRPRNGAEGRLRAGNLLAAKPSASLREIAEQAGIAVATARDVRERLARGENPLPPRQRGTDQGAAAARDLALVMRNLRNDPSLRFSEFGRVVLRLLDAHSIAMDDWSRFVDVVPEHCVANVAHAAQSCAEVWRRFAERLEQRG